MSDSNYSNRISQEIEAFRDVENIHALPEIYHAWAAEFLLPRMEAVLGTGSNVLFYVHPISEKCDVSDKIVQVLSIGAGDGSIEIEVAKELLAMGKKNFHIMCLELSPSLISRARDTIGEENLSNYVEFSELDIDTWSPESKEFLDVIIANQFLHHVVHLEKLFDQILWALSPDGVFLTTDVIGRNGHMRWHEAEIILAPIWQCLPDRYKYNHQLTRLEREFNNWDCSKKGFEGIRAQDILPLLLKRFHFQVFLAYGNLTDLFLDRGYGHNFNPNQLEDLAFIRQLTVLNDFLIENELIKPTMMFAKLSKQGSDISCFRKWTPEFCVREIGLEQFHPNSSKSQLFQQIVSEWAIQLDSKAKDLEGLTRMLSDLETRIKSTELNPNNFHKPWLPNLLRRLKDRIHT